MKKTVLAALAALTLAAGCASSPAPVALKDGEGQLTSGYRNWPVFLTGIEKPTGHIRDIYINEIGSKAKKGEPFPNGTVSVMDIYKATKGADGKLTKTELEKVFVMYKGPGWGNSAPEGLKNGDWVYAAFDAAGQPAKVDYNSCRSCHLPLADKDYIFHYDKYFDSRKSASNFSTSVSEAHMAALVR